MAIPKPPSPLEGACSVMFDNTLYIYTPRAFQAISLSKGAEWETLAMGQSVNGAACVGSTPADKSKAAFFVVGGTGGGAGYQGLQRYTYATKKWDTVDMTGKAVTQDRVMHGVVYLPGSNLILMYAGDQDGSKYASTTTFTIGAWEPFEVRSVPVEPTMPAAINPILVPWSATQAAYMGGSTYNKRVMLFSVVAGWQDSGASLAEALYRNGQPMLATMMTADDGSKHLLTFDTLQAPNRVDHFLLVNDQGTPQQNAKPLARRREVLGQGSYFAREQASRQQGNPPRRARQQGSSYVRALTVADLPAYNGTLAPMVTRTDPTLATGENGQVVIAGGNADDPLCIFNTLSNSWVNATSLFADPKTFATSDTSDDPTAPSPKGSSSESNSTSSSSTLSSSPAPSTSATSASASTTAISISSPSNTVGSAPDADRGTNTHVVLAGVLGSVFGLAIILFVLYWCIRTRRRRAIPGAGPNHQDRSGPVLSSEKSGMALGISKFPQPPTGHFRGHQAQNSADSLSSMAILMGRTGTSDSKTPLANNVTKRESSESVFRAFKSTISKPILQDQQSMARTLRSSNPSPTKAWALNRPSLNMTEVGDEGGGGRSSKMASDSADAEPRGDETRRSSGWNRYWSGGSALNMLGFGGDKTNNSSVVAQSLPSSNRALVDSSSIYENDDEHCLRQDSVTVPPLNDPAADFAGPRAPLSRVCTGSPTLAQAHGFSAAQSAGIDHHDPDESSLASDDMSHYSSGLAVSVHDSWDPTLAPSRVRAHAHAVTSFYSASVYTSASGPTTTTRPASSRQGQVPDVPSGLSTQPQLTVAAVQGDVSWFDLGSPQGPRVSGVSGVSRVSRVSLGTSDV